MTGALGRPSQPQPLPELASIAVVIPYYNGASFIGRALESVFQQTRPADEVLVVNDGSTPQQREELAAICTRFPTVRIVDTQNGGQGAARNAGVAASASAYICFLDQDDFYLPDHNEVLIGAIPRHDRLFGLVYADLYEADAAGQVVRTSVVKENSVHPKRDIFDLLRNDMYVLPSASLISRAAFECVGGFDTQFRGCEDDDLVLRIFRAGYGNVFLDRAVTVWCMHTESTSYGIHMVRSRFRQFQKLAQMFPDDPRRGRFHLRDQLIPRFERLFIDYMIEAVKADDPQRVEVAELLSSYAQVVFASSKVSRRHKLKLRAMVFLLTHSPGALIRAVGAFTRLPVVRSLRRAIG